MNRPQTQPAKLGPLLAVLGLLLAMWFGLAPKASAVCLPQDHSDLFAANSSPTEHQETDALPPKNRVWENFENSNEITPADELNSPQLRWESRFGELELASGVLSYADGNPISLSDPFGLCAGRNACTGGYSAGNGQSTMPPAMENFVGKVLDVANEMVYGDEEWRSGKYVSFDMGVASLFTPVGRVGTLAELGAAKTIGNSGPNGFVLVGEGSLHSTVPIRAGSSVNRVFDSGFATNPSAAQPLGRYFGEGGAIPSSASEAITSRGLNLPGIINDARMGAAYRANSNIPALRGPAAGGTGPELIIDPSNFRHLQLQGGYVPVGP